MTEVGSDLTVSGRVRASQGSVEGDAVMLGPGGCIPGTMIKLGKGLRLDENGALSVSSPPTQLDLSGAVVTHGGVGQDAFLTGVSIPALVDGKTPDEVILGGETRPEPVIFLRFALSDLPVYPEDVLSSNMSLIDYRGTSCNLYVWDGDGNILGDIVRVVVQDGGGGQLNS